MPETRRAALVALLLAVVAAAPAPAQTGPADDLDRALAQPLTPEPPVPLGPDGDGGADGDGDGAPNGDGDGPEAGAELARTGGETAWLAATGLGLVLAGAGLRRRLAAGG